MSEFRLQIPAYGSFDLFTEASNLKELCTKTKEQVIQVRDESGTLPTTDGTRIIRATLSICKARKKHIQRLIMAMEHQNGKMTNSEKGSKLYQQIMEGLFEVDALVDELIRGCDNYLEGKPPFVKPPQLKTVD